MCTDKKQHAPLLLNFSLLSLLSIVVYLSLVLIVSYSVLLSSESTLLTGLTQDLSHYSLFIDEMGGNVFHTTATRLTTPQLLLLLKHTKMALSPYFSGLEITRFFEEKTTHGDLDVVVGLWTGGDGWKGANEVGTCPSNPPSLKVEKYEKVEEDHDWSRKEVREFCGLIAEKLGARKWAKNGMEASFAVPLSVIDPETTLNGEDDVSQPPRVELMTVLSNRPINPPSPQPRIRRLDPVVRRHCPPLCRCRQATLFVLHMS
jgi:hypothetical protein